MFLAVVLLPVYDSAGLIFIVADFLALVACHHAIGLGILFILTNVGFASFEVGSFGTGKLAAGYALTNADMLVSLAGVGAKSRSLGRSCMRNGK